MESDSTKPLGKVIRIDESEIRDHMDEIVPGTVEETLNAMLDTEANQSCQAQRFERSADRIDTQAGNYKRKLRTEDVHAKVAVAIPDRVEIATQEAHGKVNQF